MLAKKIQNNINIIILNNLRIKSQVASLELEENSQITMGRVLSFRRAVQKCYVELVPRKYFHSMPYSSSNGYVTFDSIGVAKFSHFKKKIK